MFPLVTRLTNVAALGGGITSSDSDVTAWIAAVGAGNTTQAEVTRLTTYIQGVKALGVGLDMFFFPAGTQVAQRMCVMRRVNLTEVSSPTWVANRGYAGDGVASAVNLNWAPSSGVNFTQNGGSIGCAIQTVDSRSAALYTAMGGQNASNGCEITKNTGTTQMAFDMNDAGVIAVSSQAAGRWHGNRTDSTHADLSLNGVQQLTNGSTTVARSTISMGGLAYNNNNVFIRFSQHIIGCWYAGSSFGANIAAHDTLLHTLLTGQSAVFYP